MDYANVVASSIGAGAVLWAAVITARQARNSSDIQKIQSDRQYNLQQEQIINDLKKIKESSSEDLKTNTLLRKIDSLFALDSEISESISRFMSLATAASFGEKIDSVKEMAYLYTKCRLLIQTSYLVFEIDKIVEKSRKVDKYDGGAVAGLERIYNAYIECFTGASSHHALKAIMVQEFDNPFDEKRRKTTAILSFTSFAGKNKLLALKLMEKNIKQKDDLGCDRLSVE